MMGAFVADRWPYSPQAPQGTPSSTPLGVATTAAPPRRRRPPS